MLEILYVTFYPEQAAQSAATHISVVIHHLTVEPRLVVEILYMTFYPAQSAATHISVVIHH